MSPDAPESETEAAFRRLLTSSTTGNISLAGAYAVGYAAFAHAQSEGTQPSWYQEVDPLDLLFLGACWPGTFRDEFEFANARDAWLRLLKGTAQGRGVERFVREVVAASEELGLPVDDWELLPALAVRLEAARLDGRRLPRRILPGAALRGCREVFGPPPDLQLPDPAQDAKERVKRFWKTKEKKARNGDTPRAVLRAGLWRFEDAGLPVREEPGLLLPALYAALLTKPGERFEDLGDHATAWACSLNDTSPLVAVVDVLLLAPDAAGMSVDETLGRLFSLPAFTAPLPSDALLWTSSPGLALPRLAFELGIPRVSTLSMELTPDLLDWAGTQTRMRLNAAARGGDAAADAWDDPDTDQDAADEEEWEARRTAVREAMRKRAGRKSGATSPSDRPRSGTGVQRVWNADGSSVVTLPADDPQGREMTAALEGQLEAFREKFGREPEPNDPLFFDPDADEPTRITPERFDGMLLDMAERAAGLGIDPAYLHAWRELGYVVTEDNRQAFSAAEIIAFGRAVVRHREAAG
ncbi:hypothetical protein [Streptomyces sp. NPDC046371]|uniref:hypothetical protein n=1 Tax=unclassified Streptomyces TaxID=2593676 RepID=UPI0033D42610